MPGLYSSSTSSVLITAQQSPSPSGSSSSIHSPAASPGSRHVRLPRVHSRPPLSKHTSLDSIAEESQSPEPLLGRDAGPRVAPSPFSPTERVQRKPRCEKKQGIPVGPALRDVCGICFEAPAKPNKTRCCGQLFCHQHLSDWLGASGADGRCPTCRVPLSLERDTISLHPPKRVVHPPAAAASRPILTPRFRTPRVLRAATRQHNHLPSSSSDSDAPVSELTTDSSSHSSDSESSRGGSRYRTLSSSSAFVLRPQYESVHELASALVPFREFGRLLSLLGCALVVGALLST